MRKRESDWLGPSLLVGFILLWILLFWGSMQFDPQPTDSLHPQPDYDPLPFILWRMFE